MNFEDRFLKGVLAAHRRADAAGIDWQAAIYQQIQQQAQGGKEMTASAMCAFAVVSRAGFYHGQHVEKAVDGDLKLRDAIQRIALEFPSYGRLRITAELHRRGWEVNHKRVYRLPILLLRRQTAGTNRNAPMILLLG